LGSWCNGKPQHEMGGRGTKKKDENELEFLEFHERDKKNKNW